MNQIIEKHKNGWRVCFLPAAEGMILCFFASCSGTRPENAWTNRLIPLPQEISVAGDAAHPAATGRAVSSCLSG